MQSQRERLSFAATQMGLGGITLSKKSGTEGQILHVFTYMKNLRS